MRQQAGAASDACAPQMDVAGAVAALAPTLAHSCPPGWLLLVLALPHLWYM